MGDTNTRQVHLDPDPDLGRRIDIYQDPRRRYAQVELNRDSWVDLTRLRRGDPRLHLGFREAADRCWAAGVDRARLNGANDTFTGGSSDRWVTVIVPCDLADEAVAALRTAELDADLSGLDALAARLTVPFDGWLAPGERVLRRGRDFPAECAPTRLLSVLRDKARSQGVRVNGRVDGDSVRVRVAPERRAGMTGSGRGTPSRPQHTSERGKGGPASQSAGAFLKARADWLRVEAVDRGHGAFDIALIIDGTYHEPGLRDEMIGYFTQWVDGVLRHEGIEKDG